ncbi:MAG: copper resistance protein CopC, partial [Aeromicrobium sp.]
MRSLLVAAVLGLLTLVLEVGPASAHAGLSSSDPEDGARLQAVPSTITFRFTENIGTAFLAVTAPDGSTLQTSEPRAVDRSVTADVA